MEPGDPQQIVRFSVFPWSVVLHTDDSIFMEEVLRIIMMTTEQHAFLLEGKQKSGVICM